MTIESAKAFYQRMTEDEAFNTQYQNASSDKERKKILEAAGYSFTPEEWKATLAEISNLSGDELSDAELTEVSGGKGIFPGFPPSIPSWPPSSPITDPTPPRPMYGGPNLFD